MQGNANAMANGGAPHISFVDSEAINGSYKTNWTGLTKDIPALVKQTEEYNKSKGITTNVDKIYEQQSSIAFEKMKNNKAEIALNNSDDFQYLTFTGNYKAGQGDTLDKDGNVLWTGSQEQRERVQLAKAEYAQQQFSNQNVRTKQTIGLPKSKTKTKTGTSKKKITKLNHTSFIKDLSLVKDNRNEKEKNSQKARVEKENGIDFVRVQKLADIKKYLLKQGGVYEGSNKKVIKDFEGDADQLDPNGLYKKTGTAANPKYEIIDLEKTFTDEVLGDLNAMEKNLNAELGLTIPKAR